MTDHGRAFSERIFLTGAFLIHFVFLSVAVIDEWSILYGPSLISSIILLLFILILESDTIVNETDSQPHEENKSYWSLFLSGSVIIAGFLYITSSAEKFPWSNQIQIVGGLISVMLGYGLLTYQDIPCVRSIFKAIFPKIPYFPLFIPFFLMIAAIFTEYEPIALLAADIVVHYAYVTILAIIGVQILRAVGAPQEKRLTLVIETIGVLLVLWAIQGGPDGSVLCSLAYLEDFDVSYDLAHNRFRFGTCFTRPNRLLFGVGSLLLFAAPAWFWNHAGDDDRSEVS